MRRARLLALTAGAVTVAAAAVAGVLVHLSSAGPEHRQLLAYLSSDGFTLVDGGKARTGEGGKFDSLVWTDDGRYAAALFLGSGADPAAGASDVAVVSIDARDGKARRVPCPGCRGLVATHDAHVVAVRTQEAAPSGSPSPAGQTPSEPSSPTSTSIVDVDLKAGRPAIHATDLPPVIGSVNILAGSSLGVLVAQANSADVAAYGGPEDLFLVRPDGTVTALGTTDSNMQAGIVTRHVPAGGSQIALAGGWHSGSCEVGRTVDLIDLASGVRTRTDLSGLLPKDAGAGSDAGTDVRDLWWGSDGELYAILSSRKCSPDTPVILPSVWRLDTAGRWQQQGAAIAEDFRDVGDGVRAVMRTAGEGPSSLFLIQDGHEKRLAENVSALEVPPPAKASGHAIVATVAGKPAGEITAAQLLALGGCHMECTITGRITFDVPAWGRSTMITTLATSPQSESDATIVVVDAAGQIRWSHWAGPWEKLHPAAPATDRTGHIFLIYNPGRYDGVIIFGVVPDGLRDFDSIPKPGGYASRFYSASLTDTNHDGIYEVFSSINMCEPTCADGKYRSYTYRWNGSTYS